MPIARRCPLRLLLPLLIGGLYAVAAHAQETQSLARYAPADAGLFVELHHSEDLLIALSRPRLWATLADLAGQPAGIADAEAWRAHVRYTLRMDPSEAIRTLFADGVAFVGEGPLRSQDAIVLCRPAPQEDRDALLRRWRAEPIEQDLPGRAFVLPGAVGLGTRDDVFVFGNADAGDGLFAGALRLSSTETLSLAEDETYCMLLAQAPADPDGVLFARLGSARRPLILPAPASQPASTQPAPPTLELPGPFRGARNILLALHRDGQMLHFSAVGDATPSPRSPSDQAARLMDTLPANTLAAWSGPVDYAAVRAFVRVLPKEHMARVALRLTEEARGPLDKLLSGPTAIALGFVRASGDAPPAPALALLLTAPDPRTAAEAFESLLGTSASLYTLVALQRGWPRIGAIERFTIDEHPAWRLDLNPAVEVISGGALRGAQLCWATDGDTLLIATHAEWLGAILRARRSTGPRLAEVFALCKRPANTPSETLAVIQTGPMADLGQHWLDFLEQRAPAVLNEDWWRGRQPGGAAVPLGLSVTVDGEEKRLHILGVEQGTPASGVLRAGDYVVGVGQQRFVSDEPAARGTACNRQSAPRTLDRRAR